MLQTYKRDDSEANPRIAEISSSGTKNVVSSLGKPIFAHKMLRASRHLRTMHGAGHSSLTLKAVGGFGRAGSSL